MTTHVLILCTHNSARSVLSEGMLNHLAARLGKDVRAHSAGSAPSGRINPYAIQALNGAGIDTVSAWAGVHYLLAAITLKIGAYGFLRFYADKRRFRRRI